MADFDSITLDRLRRAGGAKWSRYPDAIGAFVAEMDFGTAPPVQAAIHQAVEDNIFGYLPPRIVTEMCEATARWQQDSYGWKVQPNQVHPVADVVTAIELAIRHYSRPDSAIIVPTPTYMKFLTIARSCGRRVIEIPLVKNNGRDEMDLHALDRAFKSGGNMLLLCNPYNPIGRVFTTQELIAISKVVAENDGRVFSDEIHAPLVYSGANHVPYASVSNEASAQTITGTSAAKAWNIAGLKCAQIITNNDVDAGIWNSIEPAASHGASNLGVIANTTAYNEGRPWLDHVISYIDENRRVLGSMLADQIPEIQFTPPEGTFIAWLDCRNLGLGNHPAEFFRKEAGVALTDGAACGASGVGFVRLVFATPRPILERIVGLMAEALRQHR